MKNYARYFSTRETPQTEKIPGTDQVKNEAGGYTWAVDDWTRLDRFLVLGAEGPTYYVGEQRLVVENAEATLRCIEEAGQRVVDRIVEVSQAGRAPKNDPALFALAMCAGLGDTEIRKAALDNLPKVARIGTHLFQFAEYVKAFRGWGRTLREAIAAWYNDMDPGRLAYQIVKYQQRDGWSHRDLLRLSHPKPATPQHDEIFGWITQGWESIGNEPHPDKALQLIWAYERAKRAESLDEIVKLVSNYRLTREMVPTEYLTEPAVWEAMLDNGIPMTALIRNLGNLTRIGILKPMSQWTAKIANQITDGEHLHKARVHPLSVLVALKVYESGGGHRSSNTWNPTAQIVDALDAAFYAAFENIEPMDKRIILGIDASGSMSYGEIARMPGITPRIGAVAMAMVTARTEPMHATVAYDQEIYPFSVSPRQRLDDIMKAFPQTGRGTDCALPILWALENRIEADVFVNYTDSDTWAGRIHPMQALRKYREKMGIPAKMVVVGMVSEGFTIADPDDGGCLDVVGFDTAVPSVIADFARG